jgi:hypothetical protein
LFENAYVVSLFGDRTKVYQAGVTGWINKYSGSFEVTWPGRFRNDNGGWLNKVQEIKEVARDLDDREGRSSRTVDKIDNIEGN